jgi:hypothetical protein
LRVGYRGDSERTFWIKDSLSFDWERVTYGVLYMMRAWQMTVVPRAVI